MSTVRKEGQRHRVAVFERDGGICASCGVDTVRVWSWLQLIPMITSGKPWRYGRIDAHTEKAFRRVLGRHRMRAAVILGRLWGVVIQHHRKSLWEAHHEKAVILGGGGCGVDGLITLCLRCHKAETADLAGQLARRPSKGVGRGF